jgi:hypothetical protein
VFKLDEECFEYIERDHMLKNEYKINLVYNAGVSDLE